MILPLHLLQYENKFATKIYYLIDNGEMFKEELQRLKQFLKSYNKENRDDLHVS